MEETENKDLTRRQQLHDELAKQARTDQQASSDSFDNQLLAFSTAALGLSIGFIKDVVPLKSAVWMPCLYLSWIALGICIVATIASFRFGIEAQKRHLDFLFGYYIERKEECFNKKSRWTVAIVWCAYIGAVMFLCGLVLTIMFAIKNVTNSRTHARQEDPATPASQSYCYGCTTTYQDGDSQRSKSSHGHDSSKKQDCGQADANHGARRGQRRIIQLCPAQH